ncbi:MAG: toxin ParE1/3/4 [Pseudomonadota bacterium]|nr:toxin ParE1/3/4 [Pseudomonadota bacterium]
MKHYEVLFTAGAEQDMEALYNYVAEYDSPASADALLDKILHVVESLATHPERGTYPKELQSLGIREYHQIIFKPYRVIYRVINRQVVIYLIADGRRDMTSLLSMRLMSPQ